MISASHNPYEDNGIKVFSSDGTKLNDADEAELKSAFRNCSPAEARTNNTTSIPANDAFRMATQLWPRTLSGIAVSHFPTGTWLKGLRIVVDCANGAMSEVAPELLRQLGADVDVICASPYGKNINEDCGAVHLDSLVRCDEETTLPILASHSMATAIVRLFVSGSGRLDRWRCGSADDGAPDEASALTAVVIGTR